MAQIGIALENGHHCSCFGFYKRKLLSSKYDANLWGSLTNYEGPSAVEMRATLGRQIVSKLSARFRSENNGRFIAVTFTRRVLAVCDSLESLNEEIAKKNLKENYYIERLGHSTIAQI